MRGCSEDPDVKGTETKWQPCYSANRMSCSEDPDVKGTETYFLAMFNVPGQVAARIPM